jgi:hypothetical protein
MFTIHVHYYCKPRKYCFVSGKSKHKDDVQLVAVLSIKWLTFIVVGARKWTLASHESTDALSFDQLEKCFSLVSPDPSQPDFACHRLKKSTNSLVLLVQGEICTWCFYVRRAHYMGDSGRRNWQRLHCCRSLDLLLVQIDRHGLIHRKKGVVSIPTSLAPTNWSLVWCHILLSLAEMLAQDFVFQFKMLRPVLFYKTFSKRCCAVLPLWCLIS